MMFKRRMQKKTDYRQRLALLKSGAVRMAVRRSLRNIHIQFIEYRKQGDKTVVEVSSAALKKYGWKGHCGNVPSAYLCGMLAGMLAAKKGISSAVLDIGLATAVKGSSLFAAAAGAKAAGIEMPVAEAMLPDKDRISGKHIRGSKPEEMVRHFEEVKNEILGEKNVEKL